jgi:hypothetical protein
VKAWIEHPLEPSKLFLVWQAPEGQQDRLRWAVGMIESRDLEIFRYFSAEELQTHNNGRTVDRLKAAGFAGHPAFPYEPGRCSDVDILKTFLRRLPPASRSDFDQYLEYFAIRPSSAISGLQLLALTEARLPSDGFSLVDPLDGAAEVCDAVFEIAGYRYESTGGTLDVGDELTLQSDPTNTHDPNAVAVHRLGNRIGFVNRLQAPTVCKWLATRSLACEVLRKNGRVEAPRAYAKIAVRRNPQHLAA